MTILPAKPNDAEKIAAIHYNNFKNAFLCDLGFSFLKLLYSWMLTFNKGFGYIIKDKDNTFGFVTGVYDSSNLISSFIKKNFFRALPILILNFIKKPNNIKKVFETIIYSKKSEIGIKAELISIAVENKYRGKGYSASLFSHFTEHLKAEKINIYKITVDKDNLAANRFYLKCGCEFVKSYKMYGKISNIYKYKIK